jgi:hypothetical protein
VLQKFRKILTLSVLATIAVACSDGSGIKPGSDSNAYLIDPQFREFYNELGGRDILGQAISPVFYQEGLKCQYTNNALLIYDPQASDHLRLRLGPLGLRLAVTEPPVVAPAQPDGRYIDGHYVFNEFMPILEKLGGVRHVGRPLTEVHYNPEERSYEQYFENLGFSHPEGGVDGEVTLLPYGDMVCGDKCVPPESKQAEYNTKQPPATVAPQFKDFVASFGRDFTGFALTEPMLGPDGRVEQVFENLVLIESADEPSGFTLQPLPEKVGILPAPLVDNSSMPDLPFLPIKGGKGFHLPVYFGDYISRHGSFSVTGLPITEPEQLAGQVSRQCFRHLCLKYDPNTPNGPQVKPEPLGYSYRDKYIGGSAKSLPTQNNLPQITVQAADSVTATDQQEFKVTVSQNGAPLKGVAPFLALTLPDGTQKRFDFPETDKNGRSSLRLPFIEARNSDAFLYSACILNPQGGQVCASGTFVIWANP